MTKQVRSVSASHSKPRRGFSREEAAMYVGIGATWFDHMVKDGRMPKPKLLGRRRLWTVEALDRAFDALPSDAS
jgi:excisionase family DNA binding protein